MTRPHFIGIGAQKAGTKWLEAQLRRHPGIWMPPAKEIHYFDHLDPGSAPPSNRRGRARREMVHPSDAAWWQRFAEGAFDDVWYRSLFDDAPDGQLTGEITPRYALCDARQIAQMHVAAPEAKLLFLLRHPVDRFWSQCLMMQDVRRLGRDESAILAQFASPNGPTRGYYARTLIRFCEVYEPSSILLGYYDAIRWQPARLMADVFAFLGLAAYDIPAEQLHRRVNAGAPDPMPEAVRDHVAAAYAREVNRLADVFGGYAQDWRTGEGSEVAPATIRLTHDHMAELRRLYGDGA